MAMSANKLRSSEVVTGSGLCSIAVAMGRTYRAPVLDVVGNPKNPACPKPARYRRCMNQRDSKIVVTVAIGTVLLIALGVAVLAVFASGWGMQFS